MTMKISHSRRRQLNRFIKLKERKIVKKALRESPLIANRKNVKKILKKIGEFKHPNKQLYLFLKIKWLDKLLLAPIFLYYMSLVFLGLQQNRFFNLRKLFIENLNWYLSFKNYFKFLIYKHIIKIKSRIQKVIKRRILEKKTNYFKRVSKEFSLKDIFLGKFFIFENSYLIFLKNQLLFKKKMNDNLFFKFCYFLKIHLFCSLIKGKNLLSNVLVKLKPLFKFVPLFLKNFKFLKPVKKVNQWRKKTIFKYRYNFSLSKVCNFFRFLYFKNRWYSKIKEDKKTNYSFLKRRRYGMSTNLLNLSKPILYEEKKWQANS